MIIQVCIGSSCHIKGSHDIVQLMQEAIAKNGLENEIGLGGCFCVGKCNRHGVSIVVDDEIVIGVTKETFKEFWDLKVVPRIKKEGWHRDGYITFKKV